MTDNTHLAPHVRTFFEDHLSCQRNLSVNTIQGYRDALKLFRYLEKEEVLAMFDAADRRTALGRRDHALLLFLYNTGARVQEAADARVSWLSLEKPYRVEILGKGRKLRTCPLWESTVRTLRALLAEQGGHVGPDSYLFLNRLGRPLSRAGIADIVGKHAARVPALRGKNVTPHTMRHTTAMHLLQSCEIPSPGSACRWRTDPDILTWLEAL